MQKYIVDFYSHSLKLVIEIDGKYHDSEKQKISDAERSELLGYQGLQIIRLFNSEVLVETDSTLGRLQSRIKVIMEKTFPGSL